MKIEDREIIILEWMLGFIEIFYLRLNMNSVLFSLIYFCLFCIKGKII